MDQIREEHREEHAINIKLLESFLNEYTVRNLTQQTLLDAREFNTMFVKYAKVQGGMTIQAYYVNKLLKKIGIEQEVFNGKLFYINIQWKHELGRRVSS